jgi:DUF4097 and DUF4098 domain-containing protein YvlB
MAHRGSLVTDVQTLRLNVSTRSGNVRIEAEHGIELSVEGGEVVREHEGAREIRRSGGASTIVVHCPTGSDVTIGTVSGSIDTEGLLGGVRIATVSGKVHVAEADHVDVRAKSGVVDIGTCAHDCRVVVTSSKVHIGTAQRVSIAGVSGVILADGVEGAEVKTVSGKVLVGTTGGANVSVHTVSGKVEVLVPRDVHPATRLRSISGRVQCECPTGRDGEIAVKSVSGAIRISCQ